MLRRVLSKANLIAVRNQLLPRSLLWQHPSTRLHSSNSLRAESCKSADDVIRSYDRTWLRENCHCPQCYNHSTQQRTVMFYELKPEAKTISKVEQTPSGDSITIHWQDGHMTAYSLTWLANNSYPGPVDAVERRLWKGAELKVDDLDRVPSETFLNEEAGVKRLI
ncbi:MAG: DUF971 domain-containing protein, partial [Gammaproteobacteria bacterium]|nr:DUF971 domain-containing protein [Gammaproteobacteria bacterium]